MDPAHLRPLHAELVVHLPDHVIPSVLPPHGVHEAGPARPRVELLGAGEEVGAAADTLVGAWVQAGAGRSGWWSTFLLVVVISA